MGKRRLERWLGWYREGGLGSVLGRVPGHGAKGAAGKLTAEQVGRRAAVLIDTERPVRGVTEGSIRQELRVLAALRREDEKAINPDAGDLAVTAGWGHGGNGKPVIPGAGRLARREYAPEERAPIQTGAAALGLSAAEAFARLGEGTLDVSLNPAVYWRNVPEKVWGYTIVGYQVMKKWLSYRLRAWARACQRA